MSSPGCMCPNKSHHCRAVPTPGVSATTSVTATARCGWPTAPSTKADSLQTNSTAKVWWGGYLFLSSVSSFARKLPRRGGWLDDQAQLLQPLPSFPYFTSTHLTHTPRLPSPSTTICCLQAHSEPARRRHSCATRKSPRPLTPASGRVAAWRFAAAWFCVPFPGSVLGCC